MCDVMSDVCVTSASLFIFCIAVVDLLICSSAVKNGKKSGGLVFATFFMPVKLFVHCNSKKY